MLGMQGRLNPTRHLLRSRAATVAVGSNGSVLLHRGTVLEAVRWPHTRAQV